MKLVCGQCGICNRSYSGGLYCPIINDGQPMEQNNVCNVWAIIHAVMQEVMQEAKDQEEHDCNTACNQATCRLTYLSLFILKTEE